MRKNVAARFSTELGLRPSPGQAGVLNLRVVSVNSTLVTWPEVWEGRWFLSLGPGPGHLEHACVNFECPVLPVNILIGIA